MFNSQIYTERRAVLKRLVKSGMILLLGNGESPMNYAANCYRFRQDSTFLYYTGIDLPYLALLIDTESDKEILFGDEKSLDDIIWMGHQETLLEKGQKTGLSTVLPFSRIADFCQEAYRARRMVHFIPPYRADTTLTLENITAIHHTRLQGAASIELIKAIISQRSVKTREEIAQIETACELSFEMNMLAARLLRPGLYECEIAGAVQGLLASKNRIPSFPVAFSRNGEILHNFYSAEVLQEGDTVIFDSGAESSLHYSSDVTRTFPVSGTFSEKQKDIYSIVLAANRHVIAHAKPGVSYLDLHKQSALIIAEGLKALGCMKGNMQEAVEAGAHALFFPHGLGHLLGLDTHDMENLGEDFVGYDDSVTRRKQFGLQYLRYAKKLMENLVITVEPGIYFIDALIHQWKSQGLHVEYIDYDVVARYTDTHGVRIEDDILVTGDGCRVLTEAIPKSIDAVEKICGSEKR